MDWCSSGGVGDEGRGCKRGWVLPGRFIMFIMYTAFSGAGEKVVFVSLVGDDMSTYGGKYEIAVIYPSRCATVIIIMCSLWRA